MSLNPAPTDPRTLAPDVAHRVIAHLERAVVTAADDLDGCTSAADVVQRIADILSNPRHVRSAAAVTAAEVWAWLTASALAETFALCTLDDAEVSA